MGTDFLFHILVVFFRLATQVYPGNQNFGGDDQLVNHESPSLKQNHNLTLTRSNILYRFKSAANNKCLDSQAYPQPRNIDDIDTTLRIWECLNVEKQQFVVFNGSGKSSGEMLIITESNKCLGTGPGSNALVQGFDCGDPQKNNLFWKLIKDTKSNRLQIVSVGKDKCMTCRGRNNGDEIVIRNCGSGWLDQIWEMYT